MNGYSNYQELQKNSDSTTQIAAVQSYIDILQITFSVLGNGILHKHVGQGILRKPCNNEFL